MEKALGDYPQKIFSIIIIFWDGNSNEGVINTEIV